jgi:hypothetical protein
LNEAALRWALDRIVVRDEVLRTNITMLGDQVAQVIQPVGASTFFSDTHDLTG